MVYYKEVNGKKECKWGELQRRVTKYPTIVKDHYKASGDMCGVDSSTTLPNCHSMPDVLDLAAKIGIYYHLYYNHNHCTI